MNPNRPGEDLFGLFVLVRRPFLLLGEIESTPRGRFSAIHSAAALVRHGDPSHHAGSVGDWV